MKQNNLKSAVLECPSADSSGPMPVLSVRVFRTLPELESLRGVWTSWKGHRDSDIDVYLSLLKSREEILEPYVAVAYLGNRPDAMLIARKIKTKVVLKLGYVSFPSPTVQAIDVVYGGLRGNSTAQNCLWLLDTTIDALRKHEADVVVLGPVRTDSPLYSVAQKVPGVLSRDYLRSSMPHWQMSVPRNRDELYQLLPPKARKNRQWEAKRLRADFGGDVKISCFSKASEIDSMCEAVEHIAETTYQRGLGVGFSNTAPLRDFFRLEAEKGWLRGYVLYLSNKECAFWIGTLYEGTFYSDYMGYDRRYSKYSPGTFLLLQKMEEFCTDNVRRIDFGIGDAWYKAHFSTDSWQETQFYLFAPTFKGLALNGCKTLAGSADRLIKNVLSRTHLLSRVKKVWRKKLGHASTV